MCIRDRVGFVDGKYILNPSKSELENSSLDLVVAGTKDAVLMVESETKGLSEKIMLDAVKFGHEGFVPVIKMIEELAKECRKSEWTVEKKDLSEVKKKLASEFTKDLTKAFGTIDKQDRSNQISEVTDKAKKLLQKILKKLLQQEISKIDQIKFQKSTIKLRSFLKKMKTFLISM